jgi:hypothetical protein
VGSLVEQQRLLQVARMCDLVRLAIGARRVALMASLDPLALGVVTGMRAFRVCVEECSLAHCSFLVQLAARRHLPTSKSSGGSRNFRQGLPALPPIEHGLASFDKRHSSTRRLSSTAPIFISSRPVYRPSVVVESVFWKDGAIEDLVAYLLNSDGCAKVVFESAHRSRVVYLFHVVDGGDSLDCKT